MSVSYETLYEQRAGSEPLFSVAIPHYQRREYLATVLKTIANQTFRDFEVVICDDGSTDDSPEVIPELLRSESLSGGYFRRSPNGGFGPNLASTLERCEGQFIFLLGNDDQLASNGVLQDVADALKELKFPACSFTSYFDCERDYVVERTLRTADLGTGSNVMIKHFRNFAFMSGLIFNRRLIQEALDGAPVSSIYLQIFLAARLVSNGGHLASIALRSVDKSISLRGTHAADWANRIRQPGEVKRRMTYDDIAVVTSEGLTSVRPVPQQTYFAVLQELITYSIPDALVAYRAAAGRRLAFRFGLAARPSKVVRRPLAVRYQLMLWATSVAALTLVLVAPIRWLERTKPRVAEWLRARRLARHS